MQKPHDKTLLSMNISVSEIGFCNVGFKDLLNFFSILSTAQQQRLLRVSCKVLILRLHVKEFHHVGNNEDLQS